jgi:hypothetical protein
MGEPDDLMRPQPPASRIPLHALVCACTMDEKLEGVRGYVQGVLEECGN